MAKRSLRDNWIIVFGGFLGNLQIQTLSKNGKTQKFGWRFLKSKRRPGVVGQVFDLAGTLAALHWR